MQQRATSDQVIEATCKFFGITRDDFSRRRVRVTCDARAVSSHIMRTKLQMSYPDIHYAIKGTRNHSGTLDAVRRYANHVSYKAQGRIYGKCEATQKILEIMENEKKLCEEATRTPSNGLTLAENQAMAKVCRVAGQIGWQELAKRLSA